MKKILVTFVSLAALSLSAASDVPTWAETAITTAHARFLKWKGSDETVVIPTITDEHDFVTESGAAPYNFANSSTHLRILRRAAEVFGADATADLGDMGIDNQLVDGSTIPSSAPHQAARLQAQRDLIADFTQPHFALVGNHDHGASTNRITSAQFAAILNDRDATTTKGFVFGPNRDYGYFDIPGKDTRVFFLNTTEAVTTGYDMSADQVTFVQTHLAELGTGTNPKTAFILSHYCLNQEIGCWVSDWQARGGQPIGGNFLSMRAVIEAFAARTDGVKLAGSLCGDSHFQNSIETNGVKWAISQGFGGVGDADMPSTPAQATKVGWVDRARETLLDVAAFKPATGEYRVFRIGKGGSAADIFFTAAARMSPLSARAYVQDGLVGLLDALENAGWRTHSDATNIWTDLKGTIGDFELNTTCCRFEEDALLKYKAGSFSDMLGVMAKCTSRPTTADRPTNIAQVEAAITGITSWTPSTSYIIPFYMGRNQHIAMWRRNSALNVTFDSNTNGGWSMNESDAPDALTYSIAYQPQTKMKSFYINGDVPTSGSAVTDSWGERTDASAISLGARELTYSSNDIAGYGYAFNGFRFYTRELTADEAKQNALVDAYRFRATIPFDTANYKAGNTARTKLLCRVSFAGESGIRVSADSGTTSASGEQWVEVGGSVVLMADVPAGVPFLGWKGDVEGLSEEELAETTIVVPVDRALSLKATAKQIPTFIWTGNAGDAKWSTAANWYVENADHTVPSTGDRVLMTEIAAGTTINNDLTGLSLTSLEIGGGTSFTLTGNGITLTGGERAFIFSTGRCKNYMDLTFASPTGVSSLDFSNAAGNPGGRLDMFGDLKGSDRLDFINPSYLDALKDYAFTGGMTLKGGYIDLETATPLGVENGPVYIENASFRVYSQVKSFDYDVHEESTSRPDTMQTFLCYFTTSFNGAFTGVRHAMMKTKDRTVTYNGDISVERLLFFSDMDLNSFASYPIILNGKVMTQSLNKSFDAMTDGFFTNRVAYLINGAGSSFGELYLLNSTFKMGAANALGETTVIYPGATSATTGFLDLNGFDQTIDRIALSSTHPITTADPNGHIIMSSSGAATLTFKATANMETDAFFSGPLTLVWDPTGDFTFKTGTACARTMPMTGAIKILRGTFELTDGNSFPQAAGIELAATASLSLPANYVLETKSVTIDGARLAPGTYTASNLPQLTGEGTLKVLYTPGDGVSLLSARAYVQDGLAGQLDGFENAGYNTHNAKATTWTDLKGTIGDFTINTDCGRFDAMGLKKYQTTTIGDVLGGVLAKCASRPTEADRPTNICQIETALSGANEVSPANAYVVPVFMGGHQYIAFNWNGSQRQMSFDSNNKSGDNGLKTFEIPDAMTYSVSYEPQVKKLDFFVDATKPSGTSFGDAYYDNATSPCAIKLGGRELTYNATDVTGFGYTLNAVRFYTRELTEDEVKQNALVDAYRFRGEIPYDTVDYKAGNSQRTKLLCRVTVNGETSWEDVGNVLTITAELPAGADFGGWVGTTDAIIAGTPKDATITVAVSQAITLTPAVKSGGLTVILK